MAGVATRSAMNATTANDDARPAIENGLSESSRSARHSGVAAAIVTARTRARDARAGA